MRRQSKKRHSRKRHKHEKICERCGNAGITRKTMFRCKYCGWINGAGAEEYGVELSKGSIDD